jgi:hypothetical protein
MSGLLATDGRKTNDTVVVGVTHKLPAPLRPVPRGIAQLKAVIAFSGPPIAEETCHCDLERV